MATTTTTTATMDDGLNDTSPSLSPRNTILTSSPRTSLLLGELDNTNNNTGEKHASPINTPNQTKKKENSTDEHDNETNGNNISEDYLGFSDESNVSLTAEARKDQAIREAELMNILFKRVEKFVKDNEQGDMNRFQNRVGNVPTNPPDFSLWVAGALPMGLYNAGIHQEIAQLQIQVLTSRNVQKRLKLATYIAATCIDCAQRRSKVQFWIIVTIIAIALFFEFVNGRE